VASNENPIVPPSGDKHNKDGGAGNTLLEAALDYHALNWAVIPICPPDHAGLDERHTDGCNHPGKVAVCKNWQATRLTEADLRRRWAWIPTFNVGVVMGPLSGLCGLDVDGPAGWKLLQAWMKENGQLPHTLCFETPGGGVRYLFRWPETGAPRTRNWKDDGKEVIKWLSISTYTVMPPSRHVRGGEYSWLFDCRPGEIELAYVPAWLLALAARPAGPSLPFPSADQAVDRVPRRPGRPDAVYRARSLLACMGHCDPRRENQQQDASLHLFNAACALVRGFCLDDATALQLLRDWDRGNRMQPYSERELQRKVSEARQKGTMSFGCLLNAERSVG
jgi:Bifunctional DNA primase/polymerase, N-terminal